MFDFLKSSRYATQNVLNIAKSYSFLIHFFIIVNNAVVAGNIPKITAPRIVNKIHSKLARDSRIIHSEILYIPPVSPHIFLPILLSFSRCLILSISYVKKYRKPSDLGGGVDKKICHSR